jgi:hypothetical protein
MPAIQMKPCFLPGVTAKPSLQFSLTVLSLDL